jgi:hypothetical protein
VSLQLSIRRAGVLLVAWLTATACGKPSLAPQPTDAPHVAAAERVIDAFYSFDRDRLAQQLATAEASAPAILFYQGWAEGGNYKVRHRAPCQPESTDTIRCAITVEDDLIKALRLDIFVTDTFRITLANGQVRSVATSSNDPAMFGEAMKWVRRERADQIRVPCEKFFTGGPTPGACVKAMVNGFAEFAVLRPPR